MAEVLRSYSTIVTEVDRPVKRVMRARVWRVFYTLPRAEKRCEERIQERSIEVLLPKFEEVRHWKDRRKKVTEPLFRNYIFAHVNEAERLYVLQTQGIVRCVCFGGQLAKISEEEVCTLRIMQNDPSRLRAIAFPQPDIGAEVEIKEGPFRGLRGDVLEHRGEAHLVVRIHTIRQAVRVHVATSWIRETDSSI